MKLLPWFEREFFFGFKPQMLPFLLERLEGTVPRLRHKVQGYREPDLSARLDGKWSIKETIGHLGDVDEIALRRIDEIITGMSPMSPAVIQPRQDYNAMSIRDVIDFFTGNREKNLQRYRTLGEDDLVKTSIHPRLKVVMSPVDLAWFDAEHDDHHLAHINNILKRLNAR